LQITGLLKPIKAGLRSKLFICGVALITGWSYWYIGIPIIKLIALLVFFVAVEIMVWQWGNFFSKTLIETMRVTIRRKDISWNSPYITKDFYKLAEQIGVKLNEKRPFGVIKGLKNAYSNHLTNQIYFGENLLEVLDNEEQLALAAHELTHIKHNHWFRLSLFSMITCAFISCSLSFSTGPAIVSNLIIFSALVITFVFVSWRNEYDADRSAATNVSKKATISLLRRIVSKKQWHVESETHPSINDRILKLKRM